MIEATKRTAERAVAAFTKMRSARLIAGDHTMRVLATTFVVIFSSMFDVQAAAALEVGR
jgi:hypothetical protein